MFVIDIPGIGEVEVDSEKSLKKLQNQLSGYYKHLAEATARKEQIPAQTLEALQKLPAAIEALGKAFAAEVREIKPHVTVEAPHMPEHAMEKPKPIKKIVLSKVQRDFKGQLTTGTEIEVVR